VPFRLCVFLIDTKNFIFMSLLPLSQKDNHLHRQLFTFPRLGLPNLMSIVQAIPCDSPEKHRGLQIDIKNHVDSFHKTL